MWASVSSPVNYGGWFHGIHLTNSLKVVPVPYVRQRCVGSIPMKNPKPLIQQKTELFIIIWFQVRNILRLLPGSFPEVSLPPSCLVDRVNSSWEMGHSEFKEPILLGSALLLSLLESVTFLSYFLYLLAIITSYKKHLRGKKCNCRHRNIHIIYLYKYLVICRIPCWKLIVSFLL